VKEALSLGLPFQKPSILGIPKIDLSQIFIFFIVSEVEGFI